MRDEAEHKGNDEAVALAARRCRDAGGITVRRAEPGDVDFIVGLLTHEAVEPFLAAVRPKDRASVLGEIERSQREPAAFGVFVIEEEGRRAGMMSFERTNARSRIANVGGLAVHPDFRGRRLADEATRFFQRHLLLDLGFHRLQLEIYGFNERAMRHAERVGCVREGVKRKAYRRHGEWVDGVLYGLVREDLGLSPAVDLLYEYVARHNEGVRTGDWDALGECFAADAVFELDGVSLDGRDAIVSAFRGRPPDDELRVLDTADEEETAVARYAWAGRPEAQAGRLVVASRGGEIVRLAVTLDPP